MPCPCLSLGDVTILTHESLRRRRRHVQPVQSKMTQSSELPQNKHETANVFFKSAVVPRDQPPYPRCNNLLIFVATKLTAALPGLANDAATKAAAQPAAPA